jgi:hydrogenase-4 component F
MPKGRRPCPPVLSGLLLNVALYAVVRCKVLVEGSLQTSFARDLMMGFGLLSVVVAALLLSRQKDVKRLFAYSSVEHMGIITFAFGMGGPVANFAALLHMTVHSLTKSAIFFTVGHAAQKTGTQIMDEIRGLITSSPMLGWGLILGTLAILGIAAVRRLRERVPDPRDGHQRAALGRRRSCSPRWGSPSPRSFSKVQPMVFGESTAKRLPVRPAMIPVYVHLALVLMLGLWIPPFLADWYRQAARLIG